MPSIDQVVDMFKGDLRQAGIPYQDEAGRFCDFHSLRHTCGSLLAASGINPKVAQSIIRHSDINLTMNRYTHIFRGQDKAAVEALPDFSTPTPQEQRVTGTDGKNVFAICLAKTCGKHEGNIDQYRQPSLISEAKTAILAHPMGVESASGGSRTHYSYCKINTYDSFLAYKCKI
jgi:hypothetical protein